MSLKSEDYSKRTLDEIKSSKSLIDEIIEREYKNCLKVETEQLLESLDLTTNCHLKDVQELQEKMESLTNLQFELDHSYKYKQNQLEAALNANYFLSDAEKFEKWISDRINRISLENSKGPVEKIVITEILEDYKEAESNYSTVITVGDMLIKVNPTTNKAPIDYLTYKNEFQIVYTKLTSSWKTLKNTCDHFLKLAHFKEELIDTVDRFWAQCEKEWIVECDNLLMLESKVDLAYFCGLV